MPRFDVWSEGYSATGGSAQAFYLGSYPAKTFNEACFKALMTKKWDMSFYDMKRNTYWGCRFFDNEADARKSFG